MMSRWTIAVALGSSFLMPAAHAGPCLDVGIHITEGPQDGGSDLADTLVETGAFQSVDLIFAHDFDADFGHDVLFIAWTNSPDDPGFPNRVLYGERIADYIRAGGSVVIAQRAISENVGPGGDFRSEFLPLLSEAGCPYGVYGVSAISIPGEHSLFDGVNTLGVGRDSEVSCTGTTIRDGALLHASLPDGRPFVVSDGPVVAVNSYFVSTDSNNRHAFLGYPAGSDYPQLFANALYFAAGFDASTACNGDYDDDGLSDEDESTLGTDFQRADSDADGTNDGIDNCPTLANPDQRDFDNDGIGDACADIQPPDTDDDGHPDPYDNCPDTPNPDQADADDDGIGDVCEPDPEPPVDSDQDGIEDVLDNCPDTANPDQADADSNGVGDACEPEPPLDTDEDGIPDTFDNCPTVFNPDQADDDDDGVGDICDDTSIGCATVTPGTGWALLLLGLPVLISRRRQQPAVAIGAGNA